MTEPRIAVGTIGRTPLAVLIIGGGPALAAISTRTPWWVTAMLASVAITMTALRVRSRTPAEWLLIWADYRLGRNTPSTPHTLAADLIDIDTAAGSCGIRRGETTLAAMIQLAPNLDLPTIITEQTVYTEDTLPVALLLPLLNQYGITVDIDIVTTGRRVRPNGDYSMLYDQLIGSHPVIGERRTWLVVRLDQHRNLAMMTHRGPSAVAGPRALAAATHRIASRLRERGIIAQVLPSAAVREATLLLHTGVRAPDLQQQWDHLSVGTAARRVTSFTVDWNRLGDTALDDCWSWNRGWTTVVIGLAHHQDGPRGLVRFVGPEPEHPLPPYLRPLPGRQLDAFLATLPGEKSVHQLPRRRDGSNLASTTLLPELFVPIGPNGQILGAISGQPHHTLAMPLYDPARYHPRRRSIDIRASLPVAQQIVLRAMVVGASVEVHSSRAHAWIPLVHAVGDPLSLRLAANPDEQHEDSNTPPATLMVFDQITPRGSGANTTLTIGDPGTRPRKSPDLAIEQIDEATVEVGIPLHTVRVDLIEPRGETRYFEQPPNPVSTDPAASDASPSPHPQIPIPGR
ncbi:type VII secretion protein EccE [Nocardia jejuensis]|uniref:type VII secretion protein EccE n=1 Tax=Nocardia jejuensis TaxID=328049 RepID=UPI00082D6168|nr:type VII secretion protein EccE [Nocardia jejuensis]